MKIFDELSVLDHEQVVYCHDKATGLKAIIAIHNTILGPALGGCRMWPYANEDEALTDVLRLSRGMTYKASVAGLNLGGGKAVIIGDAKSAKSEALFRAFGRFVQSLSGRYITAEDVGTTTQEMVWIHEETNHVTGLPPSLGGLGDPSPVTALGVFHGMRAGLAKTFGSDSFKNRTIVMQGAGQVGLHLISYLHEAGANIIVADIDENRLKRAQSFSNSLRYVSINEVYDVPCDIFAPCALGGSINAQTIPRLRCAIVAGCANNVLLNEVQDCAALNERKILYVPDFVINAGGLISVACERNGTGRDEAIAKTARIYDIITEILSVAENKKITTLKAANTLAETRLQAIAHVKRTTVQGPLRDVGHRFM